MRGPIVNSPHLGNRVRKANGRIPTNPGASQFAARFAGSPLGSFSADRLSFSTGARPVASQYVVKIPVSWLYNNGVLWRWDM